MPRDYRLLREAEESLQTNHPWEGEEMDRSNDIQPGSAPRAEEADIREYESFMKARRERTLARLAEDYEKFQETRTFEFPTWHYGPPKGQLFRVACEDNPTFGESSYLEFDSGRTAFVAIDWQVDFAGEHGYVNVMGYDLTLTASGIEPTRRVLNDFRQAGMPVVHCREGHLPDLSDAPYNKLLRSKIIGKDGVGIGEEPEGGIGPLLTRGSRSWSFVEELAPAEGEITVEKAGKGAMEVSNFFYVLQNLGVSHLVITGITTDVCVDSIMTQANDLGYWCLLLKDCTGATDEEIYRGAVKSVKMQGGVFGWVSDSETFRKGLREGGVLNAAP